MQIQIILGEQYITILHKTGSISLAFPFALGSDMAGIVLLLFLRIRWLKNICAWFMGYSFDLKPYLSRARGCLASAGTLQGTEVNSL